MIFLLSYETVLDFRVFGAFKFFKDFFRCFLKIFFLLLFKLVMLLLTFTEVTTEHQKWPNIGTNSVKSLAQSPPQELEVSPRSSLYLLVFI